MLKRAWTIILLLCLVQGAWAAEGMVKLTVPAARENRRLILAEKLIPANQLQPPFVLKDAETDQTVSCQSEPAKDGNLVRWLVPSLEAGKSKSYTLSSGNAAAMGGLKMTEQAGLLTISTAAGDLVTQYHAGADTAKFKKPFFYPVMANGVSMTRSYPMEKKAGEATDHVHHTGVYFAHGEVNKHDFWMKEGIVPKAILSKSAGPVCAHIVAENAWGKELNEIQDVTVMRVGEDVVMDWTITLRADNGDVELGKTKEGGVSVRVAQGLTDKAGGIMTDSESRKGEKQIWNHAAAWVDMSGQVEGKQVGIAMMNHPGSFRFPTEWHARGYGLFAANPLMARDAVELKKGESLMLKFRMYFHAGDAAAANVREVYAGYTSSSVD